MGKAEITAALVGLGCGIAHVLYLWLILHAAWVARGVWRVLILATSWVHAAGPAFLVILVVWPRVPPSGDLGVLLLVGLWLGPWIGFMVWYACTHPNPLKIRVRRDNGTPRRDADDR